MGTRARSSLILCGALVLAGSRAGSADGAELELALGTPFVSARGLLPVTAWLSAGARVDLVDASALRVGAAVSLRVIDAEMLRLDLPVFLARGMSFQDLDTFEIELGPSLLVDLGADVALVVRGGGFVYFGPEARVRGLVGFGSLALSRAMSPGCRGGVELGWLADAFGGRPSAGLFASWQ
ncbi:MAG: hypothetical protein IT384_17110 [Deltaproteobacteria bacterium]|nr:hypothetical protein [Deltaproteobacteria bacterium]